MHLMGTLIGALVGFIAFLIELIITLVLKGATAARVCLQRGPQPKFRNPNRLLTSIYSVGLIGVVVIVGTIGIRESLKQRKIVATQSHVDTLASSLNAQFSLGTEDVRLSEGLEEVDSWGNKLRVRADKFLVGARIVVQSDGPDGIHGTGDDISAIRYHRTTATEMQGELKEQAAGALSKLITNVRGADREVEPRQAGD